MGTNYYRVPSEEDMELRRDRLIERIKRLKMTPGNIENNFSREYGNDNLGFFSFDSYSPWDEFLENTSIHLGKKSSGWQFTWNHNNWKYYNDMNSILKFLRKGRVVDEYGVEFLPDEFFEMAINWCPDGWTNERYFKEELIAKGKKPLFPEHYVDIIVDGLRFMNTTDFS